MFHKIQHPTILSTKITMSLRVIIFTVMLTSLQGVSYADEYGICSYLRVKGEKTSREIPQCVEGVWELHNLENDKHAKWKFFTDSETGKHILRCEKHNEPTIERQVLFLKCSDQSGNQHDVFCINLYESDSLSKIINTDQLWYRIERASCDEVWLWSMHFSSKSANALVAGNADAATIRRGGNEGILNVIDINLTFPDFEEFMTNNYRVIFDRNTNKEILNRVVE